MHSTQQALTAAGERGPGARRVGGAGDALRPRSRRLPLRRPVCPPRLCSLPPLQPPRLCPTPPLPPTASALPRRRRAGPLLAESGGAGGTRGRGEASGTDSDEAPSHSARPVAPPGAVGRLGYTGMGRVCVGGGSRLGSQCRLTFNLTGPFRYQASLPPHWTPLAAAAAAPPPPLPAFDADDARPPKAAPSLEGAATG